MDASSPDPDDPRRYWTSALHGAPAALDLPTDRPRHVVRGGVACPPDAGGAAAVHAFSLPRDPAADPRALSEREGVSLFVALLAAFGALLHRYAGQDDLVVGASAGGSGPLPLRTDLSGDPTFRQLLARVSATVQGAREHADVSLDAIAAEIHGPRVAGRSPLFQAMLVVDAPEAPPHGDDLDLLLSLRETPEGIDGGLSYATDLFDAATAARMAASFSSLLADAAAHPERRVRELAILPEAEARRLLSRGAGASSFRVGRCVHELFEAQVERSPEAPAVTYEGETISYRALDERANRVAHALMRRGVRCGELVGLCVERSIALIAALIGILKAGAAYVPLDPDYPRERIGRMLSDSGARVVVSQSSLGERVGGEGREVVLVDGADLASEPVDRPSSGAGPEDVAYVIYTSGSTGNPKGVMVEHRQVARLFAATEAWYGFGARDVWTMFHSYAFDFSVWEIWGALLYGGRLVVVPYWVSRTPEAFRELLEREGVTVLNQTPSAFRQLVRVEEGRAGSAGGLPALRYVIFGGEALDVGELLPFWERHGDQRPQLVNMYGITETTVHVTYRPLSKGDLSRPWSSVIGEPIPDLGVYILDGERRPVPVGVAGEMYVSGAGVARGYLRRPELTAERFLEDPFDTSPAGARRRLYKTGDRARWLASGEIEYLGRVDQQVKIRGFRIELGEVEAALGEHPAVRQAVVAVREEVPGDRRLAAYLVARDPAVKPAGAELRARLSERLPDYMVPASFTWIEAVPLSPSGKTDRAALPAPAAAEGAFVAPRTPVEELLAGIWAEVLRIDRAGAHDDFFALGGHSLLGARVLSRISAAFGVDLPLRALFEAPTVSRLAARVERARDRGERPAPPPITPEPHPGPAPLSYAEERMWLLDRMAPGTATYNIPVAARLEGPLDAGALEQSLREIVRRHEALRATFSDAGGEPRRIIGDPGSFAVSTVDLAALPDDAREAESDRISAEEATTPFDLARGPLFRARLLGLGERRHVLLLTMHHIVADGWSLKVLAQELAALYEAFSAGRPSPLPDPPVQYADYGRWQRAWLDSGVLADQIAYWKDALRGAPASLDLPTDRPRPAVQSFLGALHRFTLPADLSAAIGALARREGVTLFMVLLAGFQALLQRCTGQDDIVVGSPIAGRTRPEVEGLIGFFVNTLVLRCDLSGEPTFHELCARTREVTLGAYAHQDVPFEKLVGELSPGRDIGRSPLFQAMIILQNTPPSSRALGDVSFTPVELSAGTSMFDLTLVLEETAGGLAGAVEYATALFDAATIERMAGHLRVLLEGAVEDPGRPVASLPILTLAERYAVLGDWNATGSAYPRSLSAHELFEERAAAVPGAAALTFQGVSLGYRELDEQATRLALHLAGMGVGRGTLVGLSVERSPAMVIGLLGILKAGAAYVPLDPAYPADRRAFVVEDAGVELVVSEAALAGTLPPSVRVVRIEGWADRREAQSFLSGGLGGSPPIVEGSSDAVAVASARRHLPRQATAGDRAYVIYTSGSTGRPKGVEIPHRALVNFLTAMAARPGLVAADRLLAVTSLSFDIAGLELLLPLVVGAEVEIAPRAVTMDGPALRRLVEDRGITVLQATPSTWRLLLDAGWRGGPGFKALVGGEAVPRDLADALAARASAVWNMYGPTETTIWSSTARVRAGDGAVSIGGPIANTQMYVLDRRLTPLPIGVPGELYIGGDGLALGYHGRPDLTAERFLPDPFHGGGGARFYRTGDLCRWRADGTLEFVGRIDHQVKIRGYRIELGEIEAVLLEHAAVRRAVVVTREDRPGDRRVVAYVVPADPASPPTADALRRHLHAALPDYMLPAAFIALAAVPLLPNGKIDRGALPAPDAGPPRAGGFTGPSTAVEAELTGMWEELLGTRPIGVHDDFFERGGHSLLAARLFRRIAERFHRDLPLATLFRAPTIEALARVLEGQGELPSWASLVPVRASGTRRPFFCVHAIGGNVLDFMSVARHMDPEQPFYALQAQGLDGRDPPHTSVEEMAAAYLEEIRTVQPRGPYALGGSSAGGVVAFEMAQQLRARGEQVDALILLDTNVTGPARPQVSAVEERSWLVQRVRGLDYHLGNLQILPAGERARYFWHTLRDALGRHLPGVGALPRPGDELGVARVQRANQRALAAYVMRPYPGPITLLLSRLEPDRTFDDQRLAWADLADGLTVRLIPGSHETMFHARHVPELARVISRCLPSCA